MFYVHVKAKKQFIGGASIDDAVNEFCAWRDANGYGASQIGAKHALMEGTYPNDKRIGTVSYNGRVELS